MAGPPDICDILGSSPVTRVTRPSDTIRSVGQRYVTDCLAATSCVDRIDCSVTSLSSKDLYRFPRYRSLSGIKPHVV